MVGRIDTVAGVLAPPLTIEKPHAFCEVTATDISLEHELFHELIGVGRLGEFQLSTRPADGASNTPGPEPAVADQ